MALALDATIMGQHSNSYTTLDEADSYFGVHYDATKAALWDGLEDEQKNQLLIRACWSLEQIRFTEDYDPLLYDTYEANHHWNRAQQAVVTYVNSRLPFKYTVLQMLQFPRNLDFFVDGTVYIPEEVKAAQAEQAVFMLTADDSVATARLMGIRQESLGIGNGAFTESKTYMASGSGAAQILAPMAIEMVKRFMLKSGAKVRRA